MKPSHKERGCGVGDYLISAMVRMMFSDVSQQFGGGALFPDDYQPAVDALGRGGADLVEMFPGSAGVMSLRHLEISTDFYSFIHYFQFKFSTKYHSISAVKITAELSL